MKGIKFNLSCLILSLFLSVQARGQAYNPVSEGQVVPDLNLGHVLNLPQKKIHLSQLGGRLVIIDFWNTACTSCIQGFAKMNALQKKFGDKVSIFLVTSNKEEDVNKLFKRITPDISHLTVITGDTILRKLFPHYGEPHHVWIDPKGVYRFATFNHNATEKNISGLLDGTGPKIVRKVDGIFDDNTPLLLEAANKFNKDIEAYSILLKGLYPYTIGGSVSFCLDSATQFANTFKGVGLSPLSLIKCAFNKEVYGYEPGLFGESSKMRLILEVRDSSRLYAPVDPDALDKWQMDNFLSYEVKVKSRTADDLYHVMQRELNSAFSIFGKVEKRKERYLAVIRTDSKDHLKSKNSGETVFAAEFLDFKHIPLGTLLRHLNDNNRISKLPIIDETGIHYKIDFKIAPGAFNNLAKLKKALNEVGLDIVSKEGAIPMLVIRDKKNMAL